MKSGEAGKDSLTSATSSRRHLPIAVVAGLLVLLAALLAGGTLRIVSVLHRQMAHTVAARAVLAEGEKIVSCLARRNPAALRGEQDRVWTDYASLVAAMQQVHEELQYVSVVEDGVTVFQKQAGRAAPDASGAAAEGVPEFRLARRLLTLGEGTMPVVVFSVPFEREDGGAGRVEAAMRADAVSREEAAATEAVASMFRLSVVTVLVAFGVCAVLIVWMLHREAAREKLRREQEHLAFSGVMANGIAHDFRNPMSSLKLDVQMLARETAKPTVDRDKMERLCDRICGTLDRMDKVFQEFLYLSRPPAEELESMDLAACVRDALTMLAPRFDRAGVVVDAKLPDRPIAVRAYPGALRRALVNILVNAEQFSGPRGAVRVEARSRGEWAILDVLDSGPGIPPADRRRVFDMFYTTRPGGTGLGLFLAKTAIERAGGSIEATEGENGRGACMRVMLPLADGGPAEGDRT